MEKLIKDFDRHVYENLMRNNGLLYLEVKHWMTYGDTMSMVGNVRPYYEFVLRNDDVLGCYVLCMN